MVEQVAAYRAADGSLHVSEKDARRCDAHATLTENGVPKAIADRLIDHAARLLPVLQLAENDWQVPDEVDRRGKLQQTIADLRAQLRSAEAEIARLHDQPETINDLQERLNEAEAEVARLAPFEQSAADLDAELATAKAEVARLEPYEQRYKAIAKTAQANDAAAEPVPPADRPSNARSGAESRSTDRRGGS